MSIRKGRKRQGNNYIFASNVERFKDNFNVKETPQVNDSDNKNKQGSEEIIRKSKVFNLNFIDLNSDALVRKLKK